MSAAAHVNHAPGKTGWCALAAGLALIGGCASQPPMKLAIDAPPGVQDARGRFAGYFCAVLDRHEPLLPDHRPCSEAMRGIDAKFPEVTPAPELGESKTRLIAAVVPGIGYGCIAEWLNPDSSLRDHLSRFGYDARVIEVDALSGTAINARMIRDAVMAMPAEPNPARLVLIGYSKGAPDVLDAVVTYPEIRPRIAGVVSLAGAIGGSPLAAGTDERTAELFRYFPGARCTEGDHHAVAALRPDVRKQWLEEHPLPGDVRFYSVVTMPEPERISRVLKPAYRKLRKIDARNDGQVITGDQIVPGSALLALVNADHWAVDLPIARSHPIIGSLLVTKNDFPREALLEAILRFIEDDLAIRR